MKDDDSLHDPPTLCWRQMQTLIENGASEADVDIAFRRYLEACEEAMRIKERKS